jgi:hypothetical protein
MTERPPKANDIDLARFCFRSTVLYSEHARAQARPAIPPIVGMPATAETRWSDAHKVCVGARSTRIC